MLGTTVAAATQLEAFWARSDSEFLEHFRPMLGEARELGASLVALPRYVGVALLGVLSAEAMEHCLLDAVRPANCEDLARCYESAGSGLTRAYELAGARLAREAGLFLVFGSTLAMDCNGRLSEVAYLFGPDGATLGIQARTHLAWGESEERWDTGDELCVFETPVGRIGLLIGADVSYPEVSRILCLQGANVLVHLRLGGSLLREAWMRGLWREIQANQVFGIESCLIGDDLPGRARIHGPLEMADDGSGVLGCTAASDRSGIVATELDFAALQRVVDAYPIYRSLNCGLYRECFPGMYSHGR